MYGLVLAFLAGIVVTLVIDHLVDKYLGEVKFIIGERK